MSGRRVCHITTVHPVDDHRILHKECRRLRAAGFDVTLDARRTSDDTWSTAVPVVAAARRCPQPPAAHGAGPRAAYRAAAGARRRPLPLPRPRVPPLGVRLARAGKRVVYDAHEDVPAQIATRSGSPLAARPWRARASHASRRSASRRLDARRLAASASTLDAPAPAPAAGAGWWRTTRAWTRSAPRRGGSDRERAGLLRRRLTRVRGAPELVDAMAHIDAELHLAGAIAPPALRGRARALGRLAARALSRARVGRVGVAALLARVKVGIIPLQPVPNYVDAYPVKLFEDGAPCAEGEIGEIVAHRLPRPLAAAHPATTLATSLSVRRQACACGRTTLVLLAVEGRVDDVVIGARRPPWAEALTRTPRACCGRARDAVSSGAARAPSSNARCRGDARSRRAARRGTRCRRRLVDRPRQRAEIEISRSPARRSRARRGGRGVITSAQVPRG